MKIWEVIRQWLLRQLKIEPAQPRQLTLQETLTFEDNAALNKLWYQGDADALSQVYRQIGGSSFWAKSHGSSVQRIHTGLPGAIVDTLAQLVAADMLDVEIPDSIPLQETLTAILGENCFHDTLETAVSGGLVIGDGAFRLTYDPDVSERPLIGFVSGDRVLYEESGGRVSEVIFCTRFKRESREYLLREHYGFGHVRYVLTDSAGVPVGLDSLSETAGLTDLEFDEDVMLAVPLRFRGSTRFPGRGQSIFDRKRGSFDALDEAWSQWMHAVRKSHVKTYIPESLSRYDPQTGAPMRPDDFTDNYIVVGSNLSENGRDQITTVQPEIEHEGYLAAYMTALDLCLQGIISPSTLGIDVKKLDNAEAQREKEKATLYTRNRIVQVLQKVLPELFQAVLWLDAAARELDAPEIPEITVPFGEYANPSFEAQVETLGKAKTAGIISNEALIDELWGDTKTEQWKAEERSRLDAADGFAPSEADF